MRGRLHHVVVDCPDPDALAAFWSAVLGEPVTYRSSDFVVVSEDETTSGLAFQRSADQRPATWPYAAVQQQLHLDIMVDDVEAARPWIASLGAAHLREDTYADPAGHPFCLIRRPGWASPLGE